MTPTKFTSLRASTPISRFHNKSLEEIEMVLNAQQAVINDQRELLRGKDLPTSTYQRMQYFFNQALQRLEQMHKRKSG